MAEEKKESALNVRTLWGGWALAILAWAIHLMTSYSLVEWYCNTSNNMRPGTLYWVLNGITLFAAVLAFAGLVLAWRNVRNTGSTAAVRQQDGGRSRFMAVTGVMISFFFLGVILMQGLPNVILEPCQ